MPAFADRVALVTGATSGIGEAVVRRLAEEGAAVVVCAHSNLAAGEELAAGVTDKGGRAIAVQLRAEDEASVAAAFDAAETAFGTVDTLVNVAGLVGSLKIADVTKAAWTEMLDANLTSAVLCTAEFARRYDGADGSIVNITSIRGERGRARPGGAAYAAAKAGLAQISISLAVELAPNIRVNAIAPGPTDTPTSFAGDPARRAQYIADMPIGRAVESDEIADAVAFLIGNRGTSGAVLVVDGGYIARG